MTTTMMAMFVWKKEAEEAVEFTLKRNADPPDIDETSTVFDCWTTNPCYIASSISTWFVVKYAFSCWSHS